MNWFVDGIRNALTGLGGGGDVGAASRHYFQPLNDQELVTLYNSSWLARQVVDIPANDATKKWRMWEGDEAAAERVAEIEADLQVQAKVNRALSRARLLGGAAILIGAGSADSEEPLTIDQVTQIDYLTVIDRIDLASGRIENNPTRARFGLPQDYSVTVGGGLQRIHPSRMILFDGLDAGSRATGGNLYGWGYSYLQPCAEAIRGYDAAMASLKTLMHVAKTDVIGIKDLTTKIVDPRYEEALKKRLSILETTVGNHRKLVMDSEEEYQASTYAFTGVADAIQRFEVQISGASDIPATRLFNQSPSGLSSTGESDLVNYYDSVAAIQKNEIGPAMRLFDQVLMKAANAGDEQVKPKWNPIKEMTEAQEAEILAKRTQAVSQIAGTQLFEDESLAAAIGQLLAKSGLQGLDLSEGEE